MTFEFVCPTCKKTNRGVPAFRAMHAPASYYLVPSEERRARCSLAEDNCIVDRKTYLIKGALELPVHDELEAFSWGVWVAVSEASHTVWKETRQNLRRSHVRALPGWLNSWLPLYPSTINLRVLVHLRDDGEAPSIELQPTDHLLSLEQSRGLSRDRVIQLYDLTVHPKSR